MKRNRKKMLTIEHYFEHKFNCNEYFKRLHFGKFKTDSHQLLYSRNTFFMKKIVKYFDN